MAASVTQASDSISRVEEIFLDAVLTAASFDPSSGIKVVSGTRDKFSMFEMTTGGVVQAYATAPAEAGNSTLADVEFTIEKKSINFPFPYDLLKNTKWKDAIDNIHAMGIPAEVQEAMVTNITQEALAEVEEELWSGNAGATNDPTGAGVVNGFIQIINAKLTAASLTAQILAGANPFDNKTTIQGLFEDMVAVMPTALLRDKQNVKFFVSPVTEFAYRRSLETQAASVISEQPITQFAGFQLQVVPNLNPRWMALGRPSNLGIGLPSAASDIIQLDVIDQRENLKNQANIFGNFGYGAGATTNDWVTYEDTTV